MHAASAMTPPHLQPNAGAEPAWFVQAAGRVWGPYSSARVARFVAEGRVTPYSRLAPQVEGPFHPAGRWRSLAPLFQAPLSQIQAPLSQAPLSQAPLSQAPLSQAPTPKAAPNFAPRAARPTAAPSRPLLVWADLASLSAVQFQALISRYGAAVAIRPTVWLVQAHCDAAALRNALSRRLTGADALLIVHAPLDQAAWFNLDSAAERELRQVWGGGGL